MATPYNNRLDASIRHDEDPHNRRRSVPMQVIYASYSRTGTMSMQEALETLGIPTWHWFEMARNTLDLKLWLEVLQAKWEPEKAAVPLSRDTFDKLLGYWGGTTDQPAAIVLEELIRAYPEAKVVLVERDPDRWYKSYDAAVIQGTESPFIPLGSYIDPSWMGVMAKQMDLIVNQYFHVDVPRTRWALFNNPEYFRQWRANAKAAYNAHNEHVKRITPKDRLLVFKLEDGWEPLCKFLRKELPDRPFPRVNETAAIQEKVTEYIRESYRRSLIKLGRRAVSVAVVAGAVALWWYNN